MLELSIPQPGEETKTVKDMAFTVLTTERELSLIELTRRIQKSYNVGATYQAVRKAVNALTEQRVLKKNGKRYTINKDWILKTRTFFDRLHTQFSTGKQVHRFTEELAKEGYAVYTLNSLFELDNFWGEAMHHWTEHLKPGDNKRIVCYGHYAWWMLINLGAETKIIENYIEKKIPFKLILLRDRPLNRWAAGVYNGIGARAIVKELPDVDESIAVNVLGDTIIQVRYPKKIVDSIREFFAENERPESMDTVRLTKLAHEPAEMTFIMFRNATIAKSLYDTYAAQFE